MKVGRLMSQTSDYTPSIHQKRVTPMSGEQVGIEIMVDFIDDPITGDIKIVQTDPRLTQHLYQ